MTNLEGFAVFSLILNIIAAAVILLLIGNNRNNRRIAQLLGCDGWSKDNFNRFRHPKLTNSQVTLNQAWQIQKLHKLGASESLIETIHQKRKFNGESVFASSKAPMTRQESELAQAERFAKYSPTYRDTQVH